MGFWKSSWDPVSVIAMDTMINVNTQLSFYSLYHKDCEIEFLGLVLGAYFIVCFYGQPF